MTINSIQRSGTLTAALNLGSSTITCSGSSVVSLNATNFTLNAGTSTIIGSNVTTTFGGAGLTYYNVSFTGSTATITITGANTFNNVTFTTRTTDGIGFINLSASQTINGTLTIGAANTAVRRLCVRSSTVGTQYTLTVATIATLADVDFQDTVAAGASGTWSGTRLGNCTNNSNITFVAGKTVYWNLAGAQSWSAVGWAATSGTAPAVNNFPLAQDTAVFDNTGSVTGTITINASWNIGVLNITKTGAMTLANGTQAPRFFGNVTLQTATVTTGTGAWSYAAYGFSSAFTSNGATFTPPLTINTPTGTLILGDAFTQPSTVITTLTSGTLDLSSYTMTVGFFNSSVATTRTLAFGTGKIVVTGSSANVCQTSTGTNLTVTGSKRIELSYSGSTGTRVILGATTSTAIEGVNILDYYITAGTDTVILSGSRTYGNIDFSNGGTSTFTGTWQNATNTVVIYGNLILKSGMVVGSGTNSVSLQATSGTKTITTAGQTIDFQLNFNGIGGTWAFQDALTMGPLETSIIIFTSGTIQFKAGTTNTVLDFFTTGTTQKYLQSTIPGTQATISQTTGDNSVSYLTIQDNNATGGATWNASASTNIDAGNNTGWTFGNIQSLYSGMLPTFGFGFRI
jgi:hypothetical protein